MSVEFPRVYGVVLLMLLARSLEVGRALILKELISSLQDLDFEWTGIWSAVLAAATAAVTTADQHRMALGTAVGIDCRTGLLSLMHSKLLKLPPSSVSKGVLSTLTGTDSSKVVDLLMWAARGLGGPLVLVAAFVIAGRLLGLAVLAAVGMALLMVPINICVAGGFEATQRRLMESQQARMRVLGETLETISYVKLFSVEGILGRRIQRHRASELNAVKGFNYTIAALMSLVWCASTLQACAAFAAFHLMGGVLSPEIVFPSLFCFNMTVWELLHIPESIGNVISALESLRRISSFLAMPEVAGMVPRPDRTAAAVRREANSAPIGAKHMVASLPASAPGRSDPTQSRGDDSVLLDSGGRMTRRYHVAPKWLKKDTEAELKSQKGNDHDSVGSVGSQRHLGEEVEERDMFLELFCCCVFWCEGDDRQGGDSGALLPQSIAQVGVQDGGKEGLTQPLLADGLASAESDQVALLSPAQQGSQQSCSAPGGTTEVLKGISVRLRAGELVCVVGSVGGGKTSLLLSLMGELAASDSDVSELSSFHERGSATGARLLPGGRVAYVPQESWIQSATLRDNVLIGGCGAAQRDPRRARETDEAETSRGSSLPFDRKLYETVINKSCLSADLEQLEGGDMAELGEKGVTVSGGQKARICLARAMYARPDVYLLDDPLSAVDAHTGERLFEDAICGYMLGRDRSSGAASSSHHFTGTGTPKLGLDKPVNSRPTAVLLVTHQVQFLPRCDRILVMEDGKAVHFDTYENLVSQGISFASLTADDPNRQSSAGGDSSTVVSLGEGAARTGAAASSGPGSPIIAAGSLASPPPARRGRSDAPEHKTMSLASKLSPASGVGTPVAGAGPRRSRIQSADGAAAAAAASAGPWTGLSPDLLAMPGSDMEKQVEAAQSRAAAGTHSRIISFDLQPDRAANVMSFGPGSLQGSQNLLAPPLAKRQTSAVSSVASVTSTVVRITDDEERYEGTVGFEVYWEYFISLGGWSFLVIFGFLSLALQGVQEGGNVWIALWTGSGRGSSKGLHPAEQSSPLLRMGLTSDECLYIYLSLGVATALLSVVRNFTWFQGAIEAGRRMHDLLLGAVLRAPLSFFQTTPQGRILNRFSKDVTEVDQSLPDELSDVMLIIFSTSFSLIAVAVASPWFLLVFPVVGFAYYQVMQYFRASARELKRLQAIAYSPVHSRMAETAEGLVCIRAFGLEEHEKQQMWLAMNRANTVEYAQRMANRWMAMRVNLLGCALMAGACALATLAITPGPDKYMAGEATLLALSVSEASGLLDGVSWLVQCLCMVEADMARVERLKHYAGIKPEGVLRAAIGRDSASDLPVEAKGINGRSKEGRRSGRTVALQQPPVAWPSRGEVEFRDVWLRYRKDLPAVLRGVSFKAPARKLCALVGRTGSGKSTTLAALFRSAEMLRGSVQIDGLNTATMGLRDLRDRLAIVPQDGAVISGTIRSVLSPQGPDPMLGPMTRLSPYYVARDAGACAGRRQLSDGDRPMGPGVSRMELGLAWDPDMGRPSVPAVDDAELWKALGRVGMADRVLAMEKRLDTPVDEGGSSLSLGERQLLCLARALLRDAPVLVLDEATASVSVEADQAVQRALREHCSDRTIITIAHRLATVIDYDVVVVLGEGRVLEQGLPADLLAIEGGAFASMVDATGPESARFLRRAAQRAARKVRRGSKGFDQDREEQETGKEATS